MCLIPLCSNLKPIVDIITDGYDEIKLLEHKLKRQTTTRKKKATKANAKIMTGTHAVSVEGVDFSGIFVELWRKRETELSTYRSPSGLQTIYSWQISKQIPNTLMCSPEKCFVGSKNGLCPD